MTLTIRVISPAETLVDVSAEEVILPSTTGQLGILTDHIPLLTALDIGVLRYRSNNQWQAIAVNGGFAEVEDNEVTVLVKSATAAKDLDPEAVRQELVAAEQKLAAIGDGDKQAKILAEQAVKTARAKLQALTPYP
jgi:F-type H+-transporting ATPase subunit epsilon